MMFSVVQVMQMQVSDLLPELAIGPDSSAGSGEGGHSEVTERCKLSLACGKDRNELDNGILGTAMLKKKVLVLVQLGLN